MFVTEKGFFGLRPRKPEEEEIARGRKLMKPFGELNRRLRAALYGFCFAGSVGRSGKGGIGGTGLLVMTHVKAR